eukprot:TRINITY_DN19053_c0_g1_i1.p1 TRINITY_DN19053_c0_g1~~TRINITY_DN19053_c0_g1_i1.p1  ORF type:complete len:177 (+),score=49.28 TRINITY_DN19053_c0_g1_i1:1-531(+)
MGHVYCTTRGATEQLNTILKEQVGSEKAGMVEYHTMEATDIVSIVQLRNKVFEKHGQIDILINNAGMYFYPSDDPTEHFCQVEKTLQINYWGLKNICNAFLPMLSDNARIVNMSSNLGHLSNIPGKEIKMQLEILFSWSRSLTGSSSNIRTTVLSLTMTSTLQAGPGVPTLCPRWP